MKNHMILFSALLAVALSSCITDYDGSFFGQGIKGEGPVTSKMLELEGFTEIGIGTSGEVYLTQGDGYAVKVETQQNIIDNLETKVSGGELHLGFDKPVSDYESLKFYITLPTLKGVSVGGSADVFGETPFTGLGNVELNIAGSGNIQLNLVAGAVEIGIAGSGNVQLEGKADRAEVNIMGSGSVEAEQLTTPKAEVSIAGSGDCTIDATEKLEVSIAGSGNVYYINSPEVESSIAGSGSVKKK